MGMWFMNTKTFLDVFVQEESPNQVLTTQYVIISDRIKKTGENNNVVSFHKLYPDAMILADFRSVDKKYFEMEYRKQLQEHITIVAALVQTAIEFNAMPIVFLCTRKEWKVGYLQILVKFIYDKFGYSVVNYIKYKKTKKAKPSASVDSIRATCEEIIAEATQRARAKMLSTPDGRRRYVNSLDREELTKELKKYNFCTKNLSKSDMRELLLYFISD